MRITLVSTWGEITKSMSEGHISPCLSVETQTDVAPDVAGLSDEELMRIVREGGQ
jgi:hypothetical protein